MGELVPFPTPKIKLTEQETIEFLKIKENIKQAQTLREIQFCKKQVKDFLKRVTERYNGEIR
ncbi:hypothetical protein AA0X95_17455 [Bacillus sp. 1P10SD]|uniref:hypothetical protein n=1 Tax=Bacillus sp. 1P10SD TaxID=3132265 RepID=UPI0039A5FE86